MKYDVLTPDSPMTDIIHADRFEVLDNGVWFYMGESFVAYYTKVTSIRAQQAVTFPATISAWAHSGPCSTGCTCANARSA